jgi:head-tail adaptor
VKAGALRYLVTIQRLSSAQTATGSVPPNVWSNWQQVYAGIEPYVGSARSGKETFEKEEVQAVAYTRVHLRYLSGLSTADRVLYQQAGQPDRTFDIVAINNRDEQNAELELICKERQP